MRIVQSLWSANQPDMFRFKAGWFAPEYHLMAWALSCLQLKQFYKDVVLYADSQATRLLIDQLKLPYTDVVCSLDQLNSYDPELWAAGKIYTYRQQQAPFIHVDGDVFIWKPFDERLHNAGLIAQNKEAATGYYEQKMQELERSLTFFPEEILAKRTTEDMIYAYNAGIMGGTDLVFFEEYCRLATKFIENNRSCLHKINVTDFNIFFEQYLFYCLSELRGKKVSLLFDEVQDDSGYCGFGDFADVPHNRTYLHLLGTLKRNQNVCNAMASRLRFDYPEYYYRIIELFNSKKINLVRDYYYWLPAKEQGQLNERFNELKSCAPEYKVPNAAVDATKVDRFSQFVDWYFEVAPDFTHRDMAKSLKVDALRTDEQIGSIVASRFQVIDKNALYRRDILSADFYRLFFDQRFNGGSLKLVACGMCAIVDAVFDWTFIEDAENPLPVVMQNVVDSAANNVKLIVVPECDQYGYSVVNADELDAFILELLEKPLPVADFWNRVEEAFDEEELTNARHEFEHLVNGRMKKLFTGKAIRINYN